MDAHCGVERPRSHICKTKTRRSLALIDFGAGGLRLRDEVVISYGCLDPYLIFYAPSIMPTILLEDGPITVDRSHYLLLNA